MYFFLPSFLPHLMTWKSCSPWGPRGSHVTNIWSCRYVCISSALLCLDLTLSCCRAAFESEITVGGATQIGIFYFKTSDISFANNALTFTITKSG